MKTQLEFSKSVRKCLFLIRVINISLFKLIMFFKKDTTALKD